MITVVGLGNPGAQYEKTRHNAGRILVEALAREAHVELVEKKNPDHLVGAGVFFEEKVRFVLPNTFMNKSGAAVSPYIKSIRGAKDLVVIYDDLDLPLGLVRVAFSRSSGGHNGLKSIERAIKTRDFIRIRVGVSKMVRGKAKKPVGEEAVVEYLMAPFTKAEYEKITGPLYERVYLALTRIIETGDSVSGMNAVNGLPIV